MIYPEDKSKFSDPRNYEPPLCGHTEMLTFGCSCVGMASLISGIILLTISLHDTAAVVGSELEGWKESRCHVDRLLPSLGGCAITLDDHVIPA